MEGRGAEPRPGSGAMFDNLAPRYDLLNRLMSMGSDKRWRKRTVAALNLPPSPRVLDLATGTADLAIDIARMHPDARIVGVDPSVKMLQVGREKIERKRLVERVVLSEGIAEDLPFANDTFDGVTIAFGIRNCTDRRQAVREMARVTRPGAKIAVLELGEPRKGLLAPLARFHIHQVVPRLGALLSGAKEYRYLQTSIEAFPPPGEFAALMSECGLVDVCITPMSFDSCHLYVGTVESDRARN